jgi:hypothetical protein
MRKSAVCLNCGEPREIAAHGLCFACYRRQERSEDRKFATVDRHSPAVRREHKKLFRGFTNVMVGLADLGVQEADVLAIRRMLEPYMTPIARFLSSPAEPNESQHQVNSEQNPEPLFTVHTSRGSSHKGEHDPAAKSVDLERKKKT